MYMNTKQSPFSENQKSTVTLKRILASPQSYFQEAFLLYFLAGQTNLRLKKKVFFFCLVVKVLHLVDKQQPCYSSWPVWLLWRVKDSKTGRQHQTHPYAATNRPVFFKVVRLLTTARQTGLGMLYINIWWLADGAMLMFCFAWIKQS